MNIIGIKKFAVEDGEGIRVSVYCSYCTIHCPGCHNAEECWDMEPKAGFKPYTQEMREEILEAADHDYIAGLTLCGGEVFEFVNQDGFLDLVRAFRERFPNKTIWAYSGYNLEDLLPGGKRHGKDTDELLSCIDVLVEGPFILAHRDISGDNVFCGSTNQCILDMRKTLAEGRKVIYLEKNIELRETLRNAILKTGKYADCDALGEYIKFCLYEEKAHVRKDCIQYDVVPGGVGMSYTVSLLPETAEKAKSMLGECLIK